MKSMKAMRTVVACTWSSTWLCVALIAASSAQAQGLNPQAVSGGPDAENPVLENGVEGWGTKGPDEAPILNPRDFNGLWRPGATPRKKPLASLEDVFALEDVPMKPAAKEVVDKMAQIRKTGRPVQLATTACRSPSINTTLFPSFVTGIVQNEHSVFILFEEPRLVQIIRVNGKHPEVVKPSYRGDSVGHWEGNTLVVDTIGFNGLGELDITGAPVSKEARMTQKFWKSADGKVLNLEVTVQDPVYLSEPLVAQRRWIWTNGLQQGEFDCEENPRSDMNDQTYYLEKLYQPICLRVEGKGDQPSKVVCEHPPRVD